jgi:hypothetical protein
MDVYVCVCVWENTYRGAEIGNGRTVPLYPVVDYWSGVAVTHECFAEHIDAVVYTHCVVCPCQFSSASGHKSSQVAAQRAIPYLQCLPYPLRRRRGKENSPACCLRSGASNHSGWVSS